MWAWLTGLQEKNVTNTDQQDALLQRVHVISPCQSRPTLWDAYDYFLNHIPFSNKNSSKQCWQRDETPPATATVKLSGNRSRHAFFIKCSKERKQEKVQRWTKIFLETMFESKSRPEPEMKQQLADEIGLEPRQVAIWFQNRRARLKTKQVEKECSLGKVN